MSRRHAIELAVGVLAVVATCASASPWLQAFTGGALLPDLAAAAVLSVALPLVVAWRLGRTATVSMAASFVALVVVGLLLVLHEPLGIADFVRGIVRAPTVILTDARPITEPRWVLIAPFCATWVAGAIAGELLARTRTTVVAGVWLGAFVLATFGATGGADARTGWTVALVLSGCATLMLRRWLATTEHLDPALEEHSGILQAIVFGTASLAVVCVASVLAVGVLPRFAATSTSLTRRAALVTNESLSPPLAFEELRQSTAGKPRALFTVSVTHTVPGYLSAVDLDDYDGSTWVIPDTLQPDGGTIAAVDQQTGPVHLVEVHQSYTVEQATGSPWMPFVSRPTAVNGIEVRYDLASGMVAPATPLATGERYQVVSETDPVVEQHVSRHDDSLPIAISDTPEDLEIPAGEQRYLVQALQALTSKLATRPTHEFGFVVALADLFRTLPQLKVSGSYASDGAALGLSFGDLLHQVEFGRKATPEQFASMLALLLRANHDPARLVTGYRLPGTLRPGRTYTVTSADAWTWVEVPVQGLGWVVVDASSAKSGAAPTPPKTSSTATTTTTLVQEKLTRHGGKELAHKIDLHLRGPAKGFPWLLLALVLLVLGLAAWSLTPMAIRALRRRRRRAGTPNARVLGAWHESLDVLYESCSIDSDAMTSSEVAATAHQLLGPQAGVAVRSVATLADEVVYTQHPSLDQGAADTAWRSEAELVKLAARSLRRADRVRAYARIARRARSS